MKQAFRQQGLEEGLDSLLEFGKLDQGLRFGGGEGKGCLHVCLCLRLNNFLFFFVI